MQATEKQNKNESTKQTAKQNSQAFEPLDRQLLPGAAVRSRKTARWVAKTGILTAIAAVLMYLEMSLPLVPVFLKLDFSDVVVLTGAFSMGPLTGILIQLMKNLLHVPVTTTGAVGELANFLIGASFVGTAGLIYKYKKDRIGAFMAMAAGTLVMTVFASLLNYYVMLPFYIHVMEFPIEAIISMTRAAGNRLVTDLETLIYFVFVPFNLFKGLVISLIVALVYKRISPLLHR